MSRSPLSEFCFQKTSECRTVRESHRSRITIHIACGPWERSWTDFRAPGAWLMAKLWEWRTFTTRTWSDKRVIGPQGVHAWDFMVIATASVRFHLSRSRKLSPLITRNAAIVTSLTMMRTSIKSKCWIYLSMCEHSVCGFHGEIKCSQVWYQAC